MDEVSEIKKLQEEYRNLNAKRRELREEEKKINIRILEITK